MTLRALVSSRWVAPIGALLVLSGCRGCAEEDVPPEVRASRLSPIESKRLSVLDRRAGRKIDPDKKLVVDAAGVTQCGQDIDCFVVTASRCAPSVLVHTQDVSMLGIVHHVLAHYTIVGELEGTCELHRQVDKLEVTLHPELVVALRSTGRTDADLAKLQADSYQQAMDRNPKRQVCRFDGDELLEAVLDLADGKHVPRTWVQRCTTEKEEAKAAGGTEAPAPPVAPPPGTPSK